MITKHTHKLLLAVAVVILMVAFSVRDRPGTPSGPTDFLNLKAPSFVGVAKADAGAISSFLDDEAGVAAYTKVAGPIDLAVVRDAFRTVERETEDYIIGSVGIPDYSEDHDPHVYVHVDGWVLAYYFKTEPASYIIDLRHYDGVEIGTTKLENAIHEVLVSVHVESFDTSYYDFRHPNATHIMLIAEAIYASGDESFSVYLPSEFTYYDRSWSHALHVTSSYSRRSRLYLNDDLISNLYYSNGWLLAHGDLTPAQFAVGTSHTVGITLSGSAEAFCGIALVYQEVQ